MGFHFKCPAHFPFIVLLVLTGIRATRSEKKMPLSEKVNAASRHYECITIRNDYRRRGESSATVARCFVACIRIYATAFVCSCVRIRVRKTDDVPAAERRRRQHVQRRHVAMPTVRSLLFCVLPTTCGGGAAFCRQHLRQHKRHGGSSLSIGLASQRAAPTASQVYRWIEHCDTTTESGNRSQ